MDRFLKKCWYAVGWSEEFTVDACIARKILGTDVVIYRTSLGVPAVLEDRCPHRFAPLSIGKLKDDILECPYHGLGFDPTGRCVRNPHGPPPAAARVKTYAVKEKDGMVWLWAGAPDKADDALIPDYPLRRDTLYRSINGSTHIKANYQLAVDNLLDLTHTTFLHPAFGGIFNDAKIDVAQHERAVDLRYTMLNFPNGGHGKTYFPHLDKNVDERDTMRWHPAGVCRFDILLAEPGKLDESTNRIEDAHILTPETDHSSHYFWSTTFPKASASSDEAIRRLLSQAFEREDKPMLERVEAGMGGGERFWSLNPVMLRGDNAAVRARRILDELIQNDRIPEGSAVSSK